MNNMFATIDRLAGLAVVSIDPIDQHHEVIAELGAVNSRRHATIRLTAAGYRPIGA